MLAEKTSEKKDYQSWVEHQKTWFFRSFCAKPFVKWRVNDKTAIATSTLIVGTRGEMKGALKCSPILYFKYPNYLDEHCVTKEKSYSSIFLGTYLIILATKKRIENEFDTSCVAQ